MLLIGNFLSTFHPIANEIPPLPPVNNLIEFATHLMACDSYQGSLGHTSHPWVKRGCSHVEMQVGQVLAVLHCNMFRDTLSTESFGFGSLIELNWCHVEVESLHACLNNCRFQPSMSDHFIISLHFSRRMVMFQQLQTICLLHRILPQSGANG